jgi:hypothetical protein
MRYLFFILLTGCTLSAQQQSPEQKKDIEFDKLINSATLNQVNFVKVHKKAKAKEKKLVNQAINKIVTLSAEVKELKSEISQMSVKVDTIYIHDTIQIKEKKNFWGKTKVDTTNKE